MKELVIVLGLFFGVHALATVADIVSIWSSCPGASFANVVETVNGQR